MTFHKDFWIAAITIAPIIALANVVLISDTAGYRVIFKYAQRRDRQDRWAGIGAIYTILIAWLSLVNLAAQTLMMGFGLWSLIYQKDEFGTFWIFIYLIYGVVVLVVATWISGMVRLAKDQVEAFEMAATQGTQYTGPAPIPFNEAFPHARRSVRSSPDQDQPS